MCPAFLVMLAANRSAEIVAYARLFSSGTSKLLLAMEYSHCQEGTVAEEVMGYDRRE